MLRRKLLIRIGLLVACFVAGAVVAIYLLQDAMASVDRINRDAAVYIDGAHEVSDLVAAIEDVRDHPSFGDATEEKLSQRLRQAVGVLDGEPAITGSVSRPGAALARVKSLLPAFIAPAGLTPEQLTQGRTDLRVAVRDLTRALRAHVAEEQAGFARYFRGLVLGLTLAALVMVNIAVFVLLRTAQVVLKPVGELVAGSRELAAERFDHRVKIDQSDEFGELARAYNRLAEQLQANEERKAETLRQLAVTLNHDLNNAMATIEMQLSLMDRQAGANANLASRFRDIQAVLARMGKTVASLKHIRRVVLTDYVDGQKMIDLEQSVAPPPSV